MRDKKLVSQLTMQHIRAKTAVKTNTSHYALARTKEENQQLNRAACLLSPHYGMQYGEGKKVETLSAVLSQINNGSRVSRSVKKTLVMSKPADSSIHQAVCQYRWMLLLWVAISRYTSSLLMKVEECHGVSKDQRKTRNIHSLYPHMDLYKLIFSSRNMPTPPDHKCLCDLSREISLLR